ncbi:MAG: DNA/RNA nuclease SfsA [Thermofilum sp.]|uniref:DNA/RNA nuclease SfsA n=1 Tax=Thermofilum pendens TaxID=2269 RepID=A0A7C4H4C7_THEPE
MPLELLRLPEPVPCTIVRRRNRFVVEVQVAGSVRAASINNTGRLLDYVAQGRLGFCFPRSGGRTDYRLFAVAEGEAAALIDTQMQMKAFESLLGLKGTVWERCRLLSRSPRVGDSTLDYLLSCGGDEIYTELKSAVLREGPYAMYPDCPTLRGRRHIRELTELARSGWRALIVFIAAAPGVSAFKPYERGDPEVARLLRQAKESGVLLRAVSMHYDPALSAVVLDNPSLQVLV